MTRTWLIAVLLTGWTAGLSTAADRVFFSPAGVEVAQRALADTGAPLRSAVRDRDGAITMTVEGAAGAGREFIIPIGRHLQAAGEIEWSVQSSKLSAPGGGQAGLAVLVGQGEARREIPLFTPTGDQHSEVGRLPIALQGGGATYIEGIVARLTLPEDGEGLLQIRQLVVTAGRNVLPPEVREAALATAPPVKALLRRLHPQGALQIDVNGRLAGGIAYRRTVDGGGEWHAMLAEQVGLRVQHVVLNLGGAESGAPMLFPYAEYLDGMAIDQALAGAGEAGLVVLELRLWSAPAWFEGGAPSDFNAAWMRWCEEAIDHVLAHVAGSAHAGRVMGALISLSPSYGGEPWPRRLEAAGHGAAFSAWLSNRYASETALRQAWQNPDITFASAELVPPERWPSGDVYLLLHPASSQRGSDSYRFYWQSWMETHLRLAAHGKRRSHGHWLIGIDGGAAHFMAPWTGGREAWPREALMRLLDSPHVDWLQIAADGADIRAGAGTAGGEFLLADAARRRDKLLLVRNRLKTHLVRRSDMLSTRTAEDTRSVQQRLFGSTLIHGAGLLMAPGEVRDYGDQALLQEVAEWGVIQRRASRASSASGAQIALIIDPEAYEWLNMRPTHGGSAVDMELAALLGLPQMSWPRIGAPYDIVLIDDLEPEKYRLLIFHQMLRHTPARAALIERCRSGGRVLLWGWSAGVAGDRLLSPRLTSEVSGISVQWRPMAVRFYLQPRSALLDELEIPRVGGYFGWSSLWHAAEHQSRMRFGPMFTIRDEEATLLAEYADEGEPAVALRVYPTWTAVYSGSPYLNPELIRALAARAGAHVYLDSNDVCLINDSFILIHTEGEGARRLRLPREESLYEVFRRQELEASDNHFIQLQGARTYLFYRGSWADWLNP